MPACSNQVPKLLAVLGVSIHQQIAGIAKEAVEGIGQVPADLSHPDCRGVHRATRHLVCEVDRSQAIPVDPSGNLHCEEQIVGNQSLPGPHLDGCEVDRSQAIPVDLQEGAPVGLTLAIRCRFDPVCFQDVADTASPDYARDLNPSEVLAQKKGRSSLI